ncbi:uncharacterized protein LOC106638149 [Copidosoma floridanum]|uniref:uncharacterized protein LOC106638149 n=1 Tax=Copidosoma floridanum TaxID=29053 RepID=UPI0006C9A19E|nr:uncharacterized protein LOC106638149 [Copidosoma floridanum]
MPKDRCCVPSCNYVRKYRSNNQNFRRSLFKCPKDAQLARKWCENVGISMSPTDHVCERHFEPHHLISFDFFAGENYFQRSRLNKLAVPTVFDNCSNEIVSTNNVTQYELTSFTHFDNGRLLNSCDIPSNILPDESLENFEVSQIQLKDSLSRLPRIQNFMTDVVQDLEASKEVLLNIKKEELTSESTTVKVETLEDCADKNNQENKAEMARLTVHQYVKYHKQHLTLLLPESWKIFELPISEEEVISFSKECTISENTGLVVLYEKNIVIYKNGNVHYSIHGKRLRDIEPDNLPMFPANIPNTETMLRIIQEFDLVKVCQGFMISEMEINNDSSLCKDDLGFKRHVKCFLVADAQQCDICYKYNQTMTSSMINRSQILTNIQPYYYISNQMNCSSR